MKQGKIWQHTTSPVSIHHQYRQTSNIDEILVGNKLVDHADLVRAGAAPTTSSFLN